VIPNPFQAKATIAFDLAAEAQVAVRIFDTSGRLLRVLADGTHSAGRHHLEWDGTAADGGRVPTGIYYCQFRGTAINQTRRLVLTR
jgi:flagellar hook assembly protein FlgD